MQPNAPGLLKHLWKAHAVVFHGQRNLVLRSGQPDKNLPGMAMLDRIIDRLLRNLVQVSCHALIAKRNDSVA